MFDVLGSDYCTGEKLVHFSSFFFFYFGGHQGGVSSPRLVSCVYQQESKGLIFVFTAMAPMGIRLSPLGVAVFCLLGVGVIYHMYAGVISSRLAAFRSDRTIQHSQQNNLHAIQSKCRICD